MDDQYCLKYFESVCRTVSDDGLPTDPYLAFRVTSSTLIVDIPRLFNNETIRECF